MQTHIQTYGRHTYTVKRTDTNMPYIHTYIHTHSHTYILTGRHTCIHTPIHICIRAHQQTTTIHPDKYTHINTGIQIPTRGRHTNKHIHMHAGRSCIHACTYIHTY